MTQAEIQQLLAGMTREDKLRLVAKAHEASAEAQRTALASEGGTLLKVPGPDSSILTFHLSADDMAL